MKINSQNIFTFIITFIPSQRYVSYIFFFLIILQKMIVWEEKHPLKKKKLYSSAKANFYLSVNCSTCFLKKYFSRCITIMANSETWLTQTWSIEQKFVSSMMKRSSATLSNLEDLARGHGSFNGASSFAVKAFLRASFVRYHSWYIKIKRWKDGA